MQVKALKTQLVKVNDNLIEIIKESIKENYAGQLPEQSVLLVTSKIISYCQGRVLIKNTVDKDGEHNKEEKHDLVKKEADLYLPSAYSKYDMMLAIKNHTLTVNAGIDESNALIEDADGQKRAAFVLWPEEIQNVASQIWQFLREEYQLKEVGVIITDSRTFPLRWGVLGMSLANCGFATLNKRIGDPDLFGRKILMVNVNVAEALAIAGTLEMGEVAEQTPLALITDCPMVHFMDQEPTIEELEKLKINLEDDVYGPLLSKVNWEKGGGGVKL